MATLQLGKTVADTELQNVVAVMNSWTGELPTDLVTASSLPSKGTH